MSSNSESSRQFINLKSPSDSSLTFVKITSESRRIRVTTRKPAALIIAALFVVPWVLLAGLFYQGKLSQRNNPADVERPAEILRGPWGRMECFPLDTVPPHDWLTLDLFPTTDAAWLFKGMSRDDISKTLTDAGVEANLRENLLASATNVVGVGWKLAPDSASILKLSVEARGKIYGVLSKHPENTRQFDPFIFNPARLNEWLNGSGLRAETVATLRGLLYPRDNGLLLADIGTLLGTIPDSAEKLKLLDILMRRRSYWLKLQVDNPADLATLVTYWGFPDREMDVEPILRSLLEAKDLHVAGVSSLLPPFAKQRLNTYPHHNRDPRESHRDCHWTSFNFFNEMPDDGYTNPETVKAKLQNDYQQIDDNDLKLGDIAVLMTDDGRAVHSCVHIAADFYFTKNGPSHISPWIVERMSEIKSAFPGYENLKPLHYRLKRDLPATR